MTTKALADRVVGDWVRDRDGHACQLCHIQGRMDWAHIHGRGAPYIRYDPDNSLALCRTHHDFFGANPDDFKHWIELRRPGMWDELLRREAAGERSGHKVDLDEVVRLFRMTAPDPAPKRFRVLYESGSWLG